MGFDRLNLAPKRCTELQDRTYQMMHYVCKAELTRWKGRERQVTSRSVLLLPSDTLHLKALPEASGHSHLKRKFCFGSIEVNWSIDGLKHKPWSKTLKIFEIISNFGKYITSTQTFLLSASSEKTKTITTTLRLLFYVSILWGWGGHINITIYILASNSLC